MADTVADVLVRLGVNTEALRSGFREARRQTVSFADDFAQIFSSRGGILGAIGDVTSSVGALLPGTLGNAAQEVGGFLSSLGRLFTSLFTRAAQNIAKQIRGQVNNILLAYRSGNAALGATIQQLEQERENAIRRLSGKKGGRKELDKLLPGIDSALADLQAKQKAIFEEFDTKLELLRTGEAFRSVAADVRDVVQQYREYVDAGGDLTRANEFLSRSLGEIRSQSAVQLAEGEQQAIEDAFQLNALLQERQQLLADTAEQERGILSRGVLERQQTVAQSKSAELEALRRNRDERLADLDQNIRIQQLKVDSESRVFDLVQDRVALEMRLLELKAVEFDREAAQLAALRDVVAGILPGTTGLLSLTPALRQELNLGGVQIFVGDNATPAQARAAGENVIEGMLRGLVRERTRYGVVS